MQKLFAIIENGEVKEFGLYEIHVKNRKGLKNKEIVQYFPTVPSAGDFRFQTIREVAPIYNSETQRWEQQWEVEDLPLESVKQNLLRELPIRTNEYILKYYPYEKQQSDRADAQNAEAYFILCNIDITQLKLTLTNLLLDEAKTYEDILSEMLSAFPKPDDASEYYWNYWMDQSVKVGLRSNFIHRVKQEYHQFKNQIETATSVDELPRSFNFQTKYPLPQDIPEDELMML